MTTSRTAAIIWGSFALLVLVIAAVALCAIYTAPDAAYATLGTVALSIGGAGGVGSLAVGLRHLGAKEGGSSTPTA